MHTFPEALINSFEIRTFGWIRWLFDEANGTYPNLKMVFEQYRSDIDTLYEEKRALEALLKEAGTAFERYASVTDIETWII